ncbi:heparinase II/III family protein [Turicibacter sanguinis]|nr:alginate lyase family protein [Turicibacter sanguinis]MDB8567895.1 alginate lyase family protein [Turicibacter sanguinis]MDB8570644.1 alginate lyase family protein [Turicibacter sanguinis]MDB8573397.1 alginate lyase family protein [Turicibacter sanguinis]
MYILKKLKVKLFNKFKIYYEYLIFIIFSYKQKNISKIYETNETIFLNEKREIKRYYEENFRKKEIVIKEANLIIKNNLSCLGISIINQEKINWSKDYRSNYIWKKKFYKFYDLNLNNGADIKYPWEISRFHYLTILGKAFVITEDKKYYDKFKSIIIDWECENPFKFSINWTCAMDVAIRAINIIVAKYFFEECIDKDFEDQLNNLLYIHGKFIYENLENHPPKSNHYISDLVGLFWLGIYFNTDESKIWLEFSKNELEQESDIQINSDGTSYECSTSYHKLVLELYLYTLIYGEKNNISFSTQCKQRIELMCEFLLNITKSTGKIPLIGDNDDGRLLIMSDYYTWDRRDANYLIDISSIFFDNEGIESIGNERQEDSILLFGNIEKNFSVLRDRKSCEYPNGGYYLLRNSNIYCLVRCGELSMRGHGGHSHNEQLSIELNMDGIDIFIDPGTYVYTSNYQLRNLFRSTKMHNTLIINSEEQNLIHPHNIFELPEMTFSKCELYKENQFIGYHIGYQKRFNIVCTREIKISMDEIEIVDSISKNISEKLLCFIIPKIKNINIINEKIIISNKISISFEGIFESEAICYSPSYGVLEEGLRILVKFEDLKHKTIVKIL